MILIRQALLVASIFASQLLAATVHAGGFGGLGADFSRNDNFNGAATNANKLAQNIMSYSGYAGYYARLNESAAWVTTGNLQLVRFSTAKVLDSAIVGLNTGLFYAFNADSSMTTMIGARSKRFDDSNRDGEVYNLKFGFKQKVIPEFWFQEALQLEEGKAKISSGEYTGRGLSLSLNWKAAESTVLTLGIGRTKRIYDVTVANERTGNNVNLQLVRLFDKKFFVRAGLSRQNNSANDGSKSDSNVYTIGLGVKL